MVGKIFGWIFLLAAGAVLVRDALAWHALHVIAPESFNSLWFDLAGNSLGIFRGQVLSTIPWLWTIVMAPLLSLWAGPVLLLAALYLLWASRAGRRRQR
jgi:hypothetical protein